MDSKKKVVFPKPAYLQLEMQDDKGKKTEINVKRYLSSDEQLVLIESYIEELFTKSPNNYFSANLSTAENSLMAQVIEICTDIELVSEDSKSKKPKPMFTIDDVFANYYIWERIMASIDNYKEFRKRLDFVVEEYKEQRRLNFSAGKAIDAVYSKISGFVSKFLDTDFSPDKINGLKELLKEINDSPILKESLDAFKNQDKKELPSGEKS